MGETYIVNQCDTFDVHMLSIERVLQKFHDIVTDSVLGREAFRPSKNFPGAQSSLFNREGERQS